MQHESHYFHGPADVAKSFLKQGKSEISDSVADGVRRYFDSPEGKKLKSDALGRLSIYAHLPYFATGLILGIVAARMTK